MTRRRRSVRKFDSQNPADCRERSIARWREIGFATVGYSALCERDAALRCGSPSCQHCHCPDCRPDLFGHAPRPE